MKHLRSLFFFLTVTIITVVLPSSFVGNAGRAFAQEAPATTATPATATPATQAPATQAPANNLATPVDMRPVHGPLRLQAPPSTYITDHVGWVEWVYPHSAKGVIRELQTDFDESWRQITRELGIESEEPLVIRIGRDPEEMAALAPIGSPPPAYATGVTYRGLGLILLTLTAPETWERPNMRQVLRHELSHVALELATNGRALPTWFIEGVAIHQAKEQSFERTRVLGEAAFAGNLLDLDDLSRSFPRKQFQVNLAYAQSADVVAFLFEDDPHGTRFHRLLASIRGGSAFDVALMDAFSLSPMSLEREWKMQAQERFRYMPIIAIGSGAWALVGVLLIVAYFRHKSTQKKTLERWAKEEAAVDSLMLAAEEERAAHEAAHRFTERVAKLVVVESPPVKDPTVPTVEHDGRSHTLH